MDSTELLATTDPAKVQLETKARESLESIKREIARHSESKTKVQNVVKIVESYYTSDTLPKITRTPISLGGIYILNEREIKVLKKLRNEFKERRKEEGEEVFNLMNRVSTIIVKYLSDIHENWPNAKKAVE